MTHVFGEKSKTNLVGVHPIMVRVANLAITKSAADFSVFEGVRTLDRQRKLVAAGASKTLKSKHLVHEDGFGHAYDLVPWIDGMPRWEWGPIYEIARAVREAAIEVGGDAMKIVWGGVWDRRLVELGATAKEIALAVQAYQVRHPGPDFLDGPHFQLGA